jgi:hypothetical protein
MRRCSVATMVLWASALIGCATTAPDDHSTGPRCEATVNSAETRTPVWFNISPGKAYISVTCSNPYDASNVMAVASYPPSIGTTIYSTDSLSALGGLYRSPNGVNYVTWGAGASGSITITAWDSTAGVISGHFSFTANPESSDGSGVLLASPPVVTSVVFIDAHIQP